MKLLSYDDVQKCLTKFSVAKKTVLKNEEEKG